MGEGGTRIIAVANEKGGVGKTVTVINLAAALSLLDKRVLVVDVDPQHNATKGLGVETEEGAVTVYDVMAKDAAAADALVQTPYKGIDVIPSHVDLAGAEIELVDAEGREDKLADALATVLDGYDAVLIDTPPSLSLLTVNVFSCAREVLVPCQTHPYSFDALEELFDTLSAVEDAINPDLAITGILPTFFDGRTRVSNRVLERLREDERYQDHVLSTVIRVNTTIAESADVGKPVVLYRRGSTGAADYRDLAGEILARAPNPL